MTEPRLSTVFDYSNLRLHPNGTRVYQKSTNLTPRIAKVAVRTFRNNWIARDAGGLANIRQLRNIKKPSQDHRDDEFIGLKSGSESPKPEEGSKKRKPKRPDGRQAKRQKFLSNYDYLRDLSASDAAAENFLCEPSSDLLKCIHRYAAEYYTESGQLLNISREYRKQRKKRRDEKKAKDLTEPSTSPTNSRNPTPNDDALGSESESSQDDEVSKDKSEEKDKPQRNGRQRTAKHYRDMYKLFDGSVIMAIGMLIQEYVAAALDPQPPGEWVEEVGKAFAADCTSEDESDATEVDIDGSDSNAEIGSDEQDCDEDESSLRNDGEDSDSNDDSPPRSPTQDEVKSDPRNEWLGGRCAISDRGRRDSQIQAYKSADPAHVDLGSDEDDPIEFSEDEFTRSDDTEDDESEI